VGPSPAFQPAVFAFPQPNESSTLFAKVALCAIAAPVAWHYDFMNTVSVRISSPPRLWEIVNIALQKLQPVGKTTK